MRNQNGNAQNQKNAQRPMKPAAAVSAESKALAVSAGAVGALKSLHLLWGAAIAAMQAAQSKFNPETFAAMLKKVAGKKSYEEGLVHLMEFLGFGVLQQIKERIDRFKTGLDARVERIKGELIALTAKGVPQEGVTDQEEKLGLYDTARVERIKELVDRYASGNDDPFDKAALELAKEEADDEARREAIMGAQLWLQDFAEKLAEKSFGREERAQSNPLTLGHLYTLVAIIKVYGPKLNEWLELKNRLPKLQLHQVAKFAMESWRRVVNFERSLDLLGSVFPGVRQATLGMDADYDLRIGIYRFCGRGIVNIKDEIRGQIASLSPGDREVANTIYTMVDRIPLAPTERGERLWKKLFSHRPQPDCVVISPCDRAMLTFVPPRAEVSMELPAEKLAEEDQLEAAAMAESATTGKPEPPAVKTTEAKVDQGQNDPEATKTAVEELKRMFPNRKGLSVVETGRTEETAAEPAVTTVGAGEAVETASETDAGD